MDTKTEILVGIGAAVAAKCQQCFNFMLNLARQNSINDQEINAVIKISKRVGVSSIKNMNKFIANSINLPIEQQNIENSGPCGCS
ncbi:MAG: carboxymuconolactone decarboxylase family protein [Candidatus Hermodarchaeota archaeon]